MNEEETRHNPFDKKNVDQGIGNQNVGNMVSNTEMIQRYAGNIAIRISCNQINGHNSVFGQEEGQPQWDRSYK